MMKLVASVLALSATTIAHVLPWSMNHFVARDAPQAVTLIFQGGPASYSLNISADGQEHLTNNDLLVSLVTSPNYDPIHYCTFNTPGPVALAPSLVQPSGEIFPINEIAFGPPQPIISVKCSGTCLDVYGDCYVQGQFVAPCCNGFCAADKCRPWNEGSI